MRNTANTSSESGRPSLVHAVIDAFRIPDLRSRILFTLAILVLFRFLAHVPVPGVDRSLFGTLFQQNPILGFLDLFSGGGLRNFSIVALGVFPYITASIVIPLMIPVIPRLQAISREGEGGRQRISQITHWLTLPIAILQGYGQLLMLQGTGVLDLGDGTGSLFGSNTVVVLSIIISIAAGTMFLVWLGELVTEKGIGNGISIIIFGGIVASLPTIIGQGYLQRDDMGGLLLIGVIALLLIYLIVLFNEAQRRIPVQYGKSVFRGGKMYRQTGSTFLPLRINSAGMIPLIFAFSILVLPSTVASYLADPTSSSFIPRAATFMFNVFNPGSPVYWILVFALVVAFAFFYTMITFQQQNLGDNLQKNGGFIPGIRPGKSTQDYLNRVILRITWGGAIFLGFIAVVPFVATLFMGDGAMGSSGGATSTLLSSTSLLIMVGVALDTMRQLESQLLMRQYEGFMK